MIMAPLPVDASDAVACEDPAMPLTVLVVDDDGEFRRLAARLIVSLGMRVIEADTVAAAEASALAVRPDAALVDVGLPDGDGLVLAKRLSDLDWSPRIVLTSSDEDAVDALEARRAGIVAFLPKAELPERLTRRLLAGS
jgi:CheY-like chemotaxis protein